MSDLHLLVTGCKGRMGQAVISAAAAQGVAVGAAIDVGDSLPEALAKCDVVIDFSSHHFTNELLAECLRQKKSLVIGTTGHTDAELAAIRERSEERRVGKESRARWWRGEWMRECGD